MKQKCILPSSSSAWHIQTPPQRTWRNYLHEFITCRHPSESKLLFTSCCQCWGVSNGDYIVDIYILLYYLQVKLKKKNSHDYVESTLYLPCDGGASSSSCHPLSPLFCPSLLHLHHFTTPTFLSFLLFCHPHLFIIPVPVVIPFPSSIPLLYPCVILISTHNPSYEQWLIGMGGYNL